MLEERDFQKKKIIKIFAFITLIFGISIIMSVLYIIFNIEEVINKLIDFGIPKDAFWSYKNEITLFFLIFEIILLNIGIFSIISGYMLYLFKKYAFNVYKIYITFMIITGFLLIFSLLH